MAQVTTALGCNRGFGAPRGQLFVAVDAAANDSDKTITVPSGQYWEIQSVNVTLATTADVGNRQMVVVVSDGTNTLGTFNADSTQAASGTEYYVFSPHYATASEAPATFHYAPLPVHTLPPGGTLRVYDSAAIAAAGDDMTVVVYGVLF